MPGFASSVLDNGGLSSQMVRIIDWSFFSLSLFLCDACKTLFCGAKGRLIGTLRRCEVFLRDLQVCLARRTRRLIFLLPASVPHLFSHFLLTIDTNKLFPGAPLGVMSNSSANEPPTLLLRLFSPYNQSLIITASFFKKVEEGCR